DLVADPLRMHAFADSACYCFIGRFRRAVRAQHSPYVHLLDREQAVAQLSVRSKAQTIAVQAKRTRNRSDKSHSPDAVGETVFGRRSALVAVRDHFKWSDLFAEHRQHLVGSEHTVALPQSLSV